MDKQRASHSFQPAFAAALADPARDVPDGLTGPDGRPSARRFAVYRNNVAVSLIDAMAALFPAVRHMLGEADFRAIARLHLTLEPPASPVLSEYGHGFAAFLERLDGLGHLPWLADLARLERIWLTAYHAADAPAADAAAFAGLADDGLARLRFRPHPAMAILPSRFAIVSLLAAARQGEGPATIDAAEPEIALVSRPDTDVMVSRISPGQAQLLDSLSDGLPLAEAAGLAVAVEPDLDLGAAIALILQTGALGAPIRETDPS